MPSVSSTLPTKNTKSPAWYLGKPKSAGLSNDNSRALGVKSATCCELALAMLVSVDMASSNRRITSMASARCNLRFSFSNLAFCALPANSFSDKLATPLLRSKNWGNSPWGTSKAKAFSNATTY